MEGKQPQVGESTIQKSGAEALKTGGAPNQGQHRGLGPKVGDGLGLERTGVGLGPVLTTDQPPEHSIRGHGLCCPHQVPHRLLIACIKPVLFADCVVAKGMVEGLRWAATLPELNPKAVATPWYQTRRFFLGC